MENDSYSLEKATEMLSCASCFASLLLEVSVHRKFAHSAVEQLFNQGKLTSELMEPFMAAGELTAALDTAAAGQQPVYGSFSVATVISLLKRPVFHSRKGGVHLEPQ